jgi:hypothetical protein
MKAKNSRAQFHLKLRKRIFYFLFIQLTIGVFIFSSSVTLLMADSRNKYLSGAKCVRSQLDIIKAATISTEKMAELFERSFIIDSRSTIEYNIIHIADAYHIPASTMILSDMKRIRAHDSNVPIIFYCNGGD